MVPSSDLGLHISNIIFGIYKKIFLTKSALEVFISKKFTILKNLNSEHQKSLIKEQFQKAF